MTPEIGGKIRFVPSAFVNEKYGPQDGLPRLPREVTGTITHVNHEHRCYTAEYTLHGYTLRESFKF